MMDWSQHVLDGREMPNEWTSSVTEPIFKGKSYVMSCESYNARTCHANEGFVQSPVSLAIVVDVTKKRQKWE